MKTFLVSFIIFFQGSVVKINSDRVLEALNEATLVVDVRTPKEYDRGHIPNALHIDFYSDNFQEQIAEISKSEPVILYCAAGGRSAKASKLLLNMGFEQVYDYSGGFTDWEKKSLEIEK